MDSKVKLAAIVISIGFCLSAMTCEDVRMAKVEIPVDKCSMPDEFPLASYKESGFNIQPNLIRFCEPVREFIITNLEKRLEDWRVLTFVEDMKAGDGNCKLSIYIGYPHRTNYEKAQEIVAERIPVFQKIILSNLKMNAKSEPQIVLDAGRKAGIKDAICKKP